MKLAGANEQLIADAMFSMSHYVEIVATPMIHFITWMHNLYSMVLTVKAAHFSRKQE